MRSEPSENRNKKVKKLLTRVFIDNRSHGKCTVDRGYSGIQGLFGKFRFFCRDSSVERKIRLARAKLLFERVEGVVVDNSRKKLRVYGVKKIFVLCFAKSSDFCSFGWAFQKSDSALSNKFFSGVGNSYVSWSEIRSKE